MMGLKSVVWGLILLLVVECDELLLVISNLRHGNRQSLFSNGIEGFSFRRGLLTSYGETQAYLAGYLLKKLYVDEMKLLNVSQGLEVEEVRAISSSTERTILNAQCFLVSFLRDFPQVKLRKNLNTRFMYPQFHSEFEDLKFDWKDFDNQYLQEDEALLNSSVNYHFPVVETDKKAFDTLFSTFNGNRCNKSGISQQQGESEKSWLEVEKDQQETIKNFRVHFNLSEGTNLTIIQRYADNIEQYVNDPVYEKFRETELWKNITFIQFTRASIFYFLTEEKIKLYMTPHLIKIRGEILARVNGSSRTKFLLMSDHSLVSIGILNILKLSNFDCLWRAQHRQLQKGEICITHYPISENNVLYELWRGEKKRTKEGHFKLHKKDDPLDNYYLRVRYNGEYMPLFKSANTSIGLKDFLARIAPFIDEPFDFNQHCGNVFPTN